MKEGCDDQPHHRSPNGTLAQLQRETQRQGQAAPELARSVLTAHLAHAAPDQHIYPERTSAVRRRLAAMHDTDMIVPPQGTPAAASWLLATWDAIDAAAANEPQEARA